ncbi:hypothetical protein MUN77_15360 [Leucobacter allii]|nr:hypothetical protein [Leucobacter allii]UOR01485.1 hypothetical protein MUN77_15360 [Leucobacter allii]
MMLPCPPRSAFTPTAWVLPHPGTNGYISSWGAMLSGTVPTVDPAA